MAPGSNIRIYLSRAMVDIVTVAAPIPPAVLITYVLEFTGVIVLIALGVLAFLLIRRWAKSPYLVIGKRRVRLLRAMYLDMSYWPDIADTTLAHSHACIAPYGEDRWVITVVPLGYMFVDGIRSHRNLLRNGAQITLGQSKQAVFAFFDAQRNPIPMAQKET